MASGAIPGLKDRKPFVSPKKITHPYFFGVGLAYVIVSAEIPFCDSIPTLLTKLLPRFIRVNPFDPLNQWSILLL